MEKNTCFYRAPKISDIDTATMRGILVQALATCYGFVKFFLEIKVMLRHLCLVGENGFSKITSLV